MNFKFLLAPLCALALFIPLGASADEVVVRQPPPLPGVYGGGVPVDCARPIYPREAIRYELEGKVIVELLIGDDGRVHGQRVSESSGWKILDDATLLSMGSCRYTPITRNGQPAGAHWRKFAFVWTLQDSEEKHASPPVLLPESCAGADRLVLTDSAFKPNEGVLLRFLTSADGLPFGIKVEKGSGDEAIDAEAVRVLASCKFTPSQRDGKAGPGNAIARYRLN